MPLFLVGLGLGDERDITLKGADAVRSASLVFLESYTSVLGVDVARMVGRSRAAVWCGVVYHKRARE